MYVTLTRGSMANPQDAKSSYMFRHKPKVQWGWEFSLLAVEALSPMVLTTRCLQVCTCMKVEREFSLRSGSPFIGSSSGVDIPWMKLGAVHMF